MVYVHWARLWLLGFRLFRAFLFPDGMGEWSFYETVLQLLLDLRYSWSSMAVCQGLHWGIVGFGSLVLVLYMLICFVISYIFTYIYVVLFSQYPTG